MHTGNFAGLATVKDRAAESGASLRTQRMADKVAKAIEDAAGESVTHVRQIGPGKCEACCTDHAARRTGD